jgi:glycosyltransferase involved in cell wall biosynthesis
VLIWHVHGSWTTAFLQGRHQYLLPVTRDRDTWGVGRPAAWDWPSSAVEVPVDRLRDQQVDVVVLQRPQEEELVERWLGRRPGRDLPAVYVEHNTPHGDVPNTRHWLADRDDVLLVHVTDFNDLMWDSGRAPTVVIRHGVIDPGHQYTGELPRAAVVINEPIRRWRVTGTDLLPAFADAVSVDLFGMRTDGLPEQLGVGGGRLRLCGDLPQHRLHAELAKRRLYVHPLRWTSLGLSLIEAMLLGMPVVGVAATEAVQAVPAEAGVLSTSVSRLVRAARELTGDREAAVHMGKLARQAALERFGLAQFLASWDRVLWEVTR